MLHVVATALLRNACIDHRIPVLVADESADGVDNGVDDELQHNDTRSEGAIHTPETPKRAQFYKH